MSSTLRGVREILNLVYLERSRGDLGAIGGFVVLGAHTQRKKTIFAPFPMNGELHVDDSPLAPAHGSG